MLKNMDFVLQSYMKSKFGEKCVKKQHNAPTKMLRKGIIYFFSEFPYTMGINFKYKRGWPNTENMNEF